LGGLCVPFVTTLSLKIIYFSHVGLQKWCGVLWVLVWQLFLVPGIFGDVLLGSMYFCLVMWNFICYWMLLYAGLFGLSRTKWLLMCIRWGIMWWFFFTMCLFLNYCAGLYDIDEAARIRVGVKQMHCVRSPNQRH
jgi:hypothetical protein